MRQSRAMAALQIRRDAQSVICERRVVSTDPPYYDNIGYADLSDFFYVWLRRSLKPVFPDLFATLAVPKAEELVATPYRHGSKEKAEAFFLDGMTQAMHRLAEQAHPAFPVTIYYAFKQSESDGDDGTASTGWETFLDAVIRAGFAISGTWPMRTELSNRMRSASDTNALASSIVLVCRPRAADAPTATRREFVTALKAELPVALAHLQRGNIAPVDLAQAAIGPGMAVYTRYAKVLDAEGKPLSVREALALINQTLDEALAEQEGDFDADSRWALAWFEQSGFAEGEYGVAETLSKAKNTSVAGHGRGGHPGVEAAARCGCSSPTSCPPTGTRATDPRLTAWEMVHHLIRALESRRRRRRGRAGRQARQQGRDRPRTLPTASTPSASARSARPRRCPTTAWSRAGPRSRGWPGRVASRVPNKPRCLKGKRNNLWPLPTTTASARRRSSHGMLVRRASPTDPVQKRPEITCLSPEGGKPRVDQGHVVRRNRGISHAD